MVVDGGSGNFTVDWKVSSGSAICSVSQRSSGHGKEIGAFAELVECYGQS